MAIEEFYKIGFKAGIKAKHIDGNQYDIIAVDFEEKLIGLLDPFDDESIKWVRCENITLIQ